MKRLFTTILSISILTIALLTTVLLPARADYKVHSVKGEVNVVRDGKSVPLTKEMTLQGKELLEIKPGAQLEILNTADSRIYVCAKPGKKSVTGCIITAKAKAADNFGNVNSRLNLSGGKSKKDVHTEAGRVTRDIRMVECCDTTVCDTIICDTAVCDTSICEAEVVVSDSAAISEQE